jgi:hypothetical protein
MKRGTKLFIFYVFIILACFFGCSDSSDKDKSSTIVSYAGSEPVGDFIVIQLDKTNSKVRRINYTTVPNEDTGWLDYTAVAAADAEGFSILNRVELDGGSYVIFAEFPNTTLVYQMFDSSDSPVNGPVYVVLREQVGKSSYYEKAYNWMKFTIDSNPDDSAMEAGFAAFDASPQEGLLYGAGYYSEDDIITDINPGDVAKISSFVENSELVANTMWTGTEGDMNTAMTLTGTQSGTNILDFGPGAGGGMGLAIPQSDVSLATAAGTYFVLVYESNKTDDTSTVNPMKVVISNSSPQIKVFEYSADTSTATPILSNDLTAIADLSAANSPNGIAIKDQFATKSGNAGAASTVVKNAHECRGSFVAIGTTGDYVINVMFDSLGGLCGFSMFDNTNALVEIIRFGFGIKDANYVNQ